VLLLITIHANFVAANDSIQAILVAESLRHIRAELHADASLAGTSARGSLGICPQHLHHQTRLARLPLGVPIQLANVIKSYIVI
jgi:hypothetical protein